MTTYMPLDCDGFAAKLADYLEGDAPDAVRAAMETHAAVCADCRQLLEDIGTIRDEAAALPALTPSRDLWAGISERIDTPVIPFERKQSAIVVRRTWARPAIAAAALVIFTAGITYGVTRSTIIRGGDSTAAAPPQIATVTKTPAPDSVEPSSTPLGTSNTTIASAGPSAPSAPTQSTVRRSATPSPEPAQSPAAYLANGGENVMRQTEPVYDREIDKLRHIVKTRRSQLDPKTVTVLEQSIAVIDSAIAQSRAALKADPASGFLAKELNQSLEKKVELLRTAAMLPART
jgi:hypothetical protein